MSDHGQGRSSNGWGRYLGRGLRSAMLVAAVGTGIRVGGNLVVIPLLVVCLTAEELALWWVLIALGNVAQLADFGLGHALSRVYSFLWAGADDFDAEGLRAPTGATEPNIPRVRELHGTVRRLYSWLSVGATLLLLVVGTAYLAEPVAESVSPRQVWVVWFSYLLVVGYSLGTTHWSLACQGVNRVRDVHTANLWGGIVYLVLLGGLLLWGAGLLSLVIAGAARGWLSRSIVRRGYELAVPVEAGRKDHLDLGILRRLWPNARKFGLLSIGAYLINNGSVLICRRVLGEEATASFGLTAQVGTFAVNFAGLWLGVKWPEITILRTQGRLREMSVLFARRLACVMGTYATLAVTILLLSDVLSGLKGASTALLPGWPLAVYLAYLGHHLFYVQFGLLTFTENVVPFFRIGMFTGIGVLLGTWAGTVFLGLWGLLMAPWVVESICSNWYTVLRGFRGQALSVKEFVRAALVGRA